MLRIGNTEGKIPLCLEDNIRKDDEVIRCEVMDWINLRQDKGQGILR
jgi:hypothetical protein